jgi:hypothetical protein
MSTPIRPQLLTDGVIASYIHEISARHRPAESIPAYRDGIRSDGRDLLEVALDGVGAPDLRVIRISARIPKRAALAQEVPAAVELDLQCA